MGLREGFSCFYHNWGISTSYIIKSKLLYSETPNFHDTHLRYRETNPKQFKH